MAKDSAGVFLCYRVLVGSNQLLPLESAATFAPSLR